MSDNNDLATARGKATFNTEPLTHWLDGGMERTLQRRKFLRAIEDEPIFNLDSDMNKDRITRYRDALGRARRLKELEKELDVGDPVALHTLRLVAAFDDPTSLHELMFIPNVQALCTKEQQDHWLPQCQDWRVIGCYAQTEIGHGSNVRGLETTASYIQETDEFVLNSPTPTACKFWPGSLGRTANTAMVIARLITNGIDHGIHNFLVPIRDRVSHEPLKGVASGDIGPKLGFNNMDNGYLQLSGVRVPRENMAARFAHVDPSTGAYVPSSDSTSRKLAGLTMTQVRAHIIRSAGQALASACTIAIRYSSVRRQGFTESGSSEHAVIEYVTQRHRLLPLLASSFCFHVGGVAMADLMARTEALVAKDASQVPATLLAEVHALSSGLKALCTGAAADGIETCRRACGGHGYLLSSGLPSLLGTYLQTVTVEGDNYLLPQQSTKFLLKVYDGLKTVFSAASREKGAASDLEATFQAAAPSVPASCVYLMDFLANPNAVCEATCPSDFLLKDDSAGDAGADEGPALSLLVKAFDHRAGRLIAALSSLLEDYGRRGGKSPHEAWIASLVEVQRASHAHCQAYLFRTFVAFITSAPTTATASSSSRSSCATLTDCACRASLKRLCLVYGLEGVEAEVGDWLEGGFLSTEQAGWVRSSVRVALGGAVADDSVALCDSWDFADRQLQSTLGRKDGQVYAAVLEKAKESPLNTGLSAADYRYLLRPLGSQVVSESPLSRL